MMFSLRTLSAVGAATLALSGCSILPKPAPPDIVYRLSLDGDSVTPLPNAEILQVDRPSATSIFNSTSIVVSPDGRRLSSVSEARWPEAIPLMIQEAFVDALRRSPNVIGVLPSSGARTDTRLHITIKNFEAQFDQGPDAAPLAVVRYTAEIANASDRKLIGTFSTRQTLRAKEGRVSSIVEAMEIANNKAMLEVVEWIEQSVQSGAL